MSVDENVLVSIARAAGRAKLDFVLVGNAAAALQDAPVMTRDFDLFVRDTPRNRQKIKLMAELLNGALTEPYEPLSRMLRIVGGDAPVDFVFGLSSHRRFESVRSRASRLKLGGQEILVASLADIIAAKEAAGRPKDKATLPILRDTLRTQQEMEKTPR